MIRATYSYFAVPGQVLDFGFRGYWPRLPRMLVSLGFHDYTYRAFT